VLLAGGLSNLLDSLLKPATPEAEFALSHLVPLPIGIALGLAFARWSGWSRDIWSQTPAFAPTAAPRRRWMLAIPLLLLIAPLEGLFRVPWGDRSVWFILLLAVGCLGIGIGEELFYRGILRVSIQRHGELLALLVTSVLFGVSHALGSMIHGVPAPSIAFQVSATAMDGALYFGAFLATGRLWVPIVIHAFTDYVLYLQTGNADAAPGHAVPDPGPVTIGAQFVLGALLVVLLISSARRDVRARRAAKAAA